MDLARNLREHRSGWSLGAAVLLPVGVAVGFVPLRTSFTNAGAALVFVVLIVGMAIWGRRAGGYLSSASSALCFDFFLTHPYERLAITHRGDVETTISLLVLGVVVTELAARSRRHRERAGVQSGHVTMLAATASSASGAATLEETVATAQQAICDLLHLSACRFEVDMSGPPYAQILADGRVVHVGMNWPANEIGIPGPLTQIDCTWRGRVLGRFLLTPAPGEAVTLEDRVTAVALVNLVAALVHDQHRGRG